MTTNNTIEPGMHASIPAPVYHDSEAWQLPSKSLLAILADKSPMHLRHIMEHGREPTQAMEFGTAAHAALFEPELFEAEYMISGNCTAVIADKKSKNFGKPCGKPGLSQVDGAWCCGTHGGIESHNTISQADHERIVGIREAVKMDPNAIQLIRARGWTEVSFAWDDMNTGERCKCRIDRLGKLENFVPHIWDEKQNRFVPSDAKPWTGYAVTDLKSTANAGPKGFRDFIKTFTSLHYEVQAAMNLVAVMEAFKVTADQVRFFYIAVESEAPHALCVYEVNREVLNWGWLLFQKLLAQYSRCKKTGIWPGYNSRVVPVELPSWVNVDKLDEEIVYDIAAN